MLTVALCDDDQEQLAKMEGLLADYGARRPGSVLRTAAFSSGEALLDAWEDGGFDLYILDIMMSGISGIQTGERLREMGASGEIVFLTVSNEYAADSYGVGAFFYLLKPVDRDKLFSVLDRVTDKLRRRRQEGVVVSTAGGPRHIPFEQILYAERAGRVMRYHCTDGTVDSRTLRGSFRETAAPLLADPRFYLCGASLVVDLAHVTGVEGAAALLDSGETVPLPRAAVAAFKDAWGKFWLRGG